MHEQQHNEACRPNTEGLFYQAGFLLDFLHHYAVCHSVTLNLFFSFFQSRSGASVVAELPVVMVTAMSPTHTRPPPGLNVSVCMCSVLSCPLPAESPPDNEGSVRLRRETPRGPAEGPPDQGGPGGGSCVAADHQRGGSDPASGENHPGHRRTGHRLEGKKKTNTNINLKGTLLDPLDQRWAN